MKSIKFYPIWAIKAITFSSTFRRVLFSLVGVLISFLATAQIPTISSFSPAMAAAFTTVTINGTNFTGTTAVRFGGTNALAFNVVNSTTITATVGYGNSGSVTVINANGTGTRAGFLHQSLNRIVTDFGGYWSSTIAANNLIKPDSSHNLLAFGYNGAVYATGANNSILASNNINFINTSFRALPVAGISGNNPGGSVYLALAKKNDGSASIANQTTVATVTLRSALTDGLRGLDLGTGFTNLPSTANLTFNIFSVDVDKINDSIPDILLTQIAQPLSGNDVFSLTDSAGTLIGNTVTQNMTELGPFGTYDLDLFNLTPGAPFNSATAYSAATTNTNREIRLVAFRLSDFGITVSNYHLVKQLRIAPSTNSDYAFIAYNTTTFNLPPNITQNAALTNASICSGGTAALAVFATAAAGGILVYSWERSTNNGVTWTTVNNGGSFSGATSNRLVIAGAANTDRYRCTVLEPESGLSSTSAVFTIAVISPSSPTAVSIAGGTTVCRNTSMQLTSSVTGGSNLFYQWQSAATISGPFSLINEANWNTYEPPTTTTSTMVYRLIVSSGNGCSGSVTSGTQTVIVDGISGVTNAARCSNGTVTMSANSTSGLIRWYANDTTSTILSTGNSYTTPSLSATTTYFVAPNSAGCTGAIRVAVTATVNPFGQWTGGTSGDWNIPGNWCGGIPTSSTNVLIPANATVNIQSANAVANAVTIAATGSLVMTGSHNLQISNGGNITNNGTLNAAGSTGTIAFLGTGTVSGTTTFNNIDAFGALNFGTSSTINGTFSLQTGGSVTGNSPTYACPSSTLLYKPGNNFTRGLEWTNSSSGAGYPANVVIQNNTNINFPSSGQGYICNDITIENGSSLLQNFSGGSAALNVGRNITINGTLALGSLAGGDLSVGGNWTRNATGVFQANDRKVTFNGPSNFSGNGTSMSTISAPASVLKNNEGGFGGENFAHLWIDKTNATDSVVLLSNITVNRQLAFTRGTFSLRNSDVTIVSNSTRTADIAPVLNLANMNVRYGGTGKFVVQRFIQNPTSVRSWRLIGSPFQNDLAPTINEAYQQGVVNPDRTNPNAGGGIYNPWPGYGTHITGTGGLFNAVNGFDHGTSSASILMNTAGDTWAAPTSTTFTKITDKQGWMIFIRGDRGFSIGNQYVPSQNTILEPKGRINIGPVVVPVTAGRQVLSNPYPSAISLANVNVAGAAGIFSTYYLWDPKMFTSYTQPGKWVTFTGIGSMFVKTSSTSAYTSNGTIESGQAFILNTLGAGNVTFNETDKLSLTSSLTGIANRPVSVPTIPLFRTDIYANNNGVYRLTDGILNIFDENYNNGVDDEDAKKFINFNTRESLSILRDSIKLAIEKRRNIVLDDTIFFSMSKLNELPYRFRFDAKNFAPGIEAWFEDKFNASRILLNTNDITEVDFSITADPLSKAEDRMRVVFKSNIGSVLPVTFTQVKAVPQDNTIVVEWKVENQINVARYEIEKSADGNQFNKVNTLKANGITSTTSTYNWIDENAFAGVNYFRIKMIGLDGKISYSKVVKVIFMTKSGIAIYPNPVTNNNYNLQMVAQQAGVYQINTYSSNGQKMCNYRLVYNGTDDVCNIKLKKKLASGLYRVEIVNQAAGSSTSINMIVE